MSHKECSYRYSTVAVQSKMQSALCYSYMAMGLNAGEDAAASDLFSVPTPRDAAIFPPAAELL